jgi:hypothetical protein
MVNRRGGEDWRWPLLGRVVVRRWTMITSAHQERGLRPQGRHDGVTRAQGLKPPVIRSLLLLLLNIVFFPSCLTNLYSHSSSSQYLPQPSLPPIFSNLTPPPPLMSASPFSSMESALAAFAAGKFVVVMDDESRENEGDLLIAASECTSEKMAWFIKHTSCVEPPPPLPSPVGPKC